MEAKSQNYNKEELKIYLLLLCSKADSIITQEELNFIKSKLDVAIFKKIYKNFLSHTEDEVLEIIEDTINELQLSHLEILEIKNQMKTLFFIDNNYTMKEKNLTRIINNILY
jgi:hypothetical protein